MQSINFDDSGYRWLLNHPNATVYDGDLILAGMPIHSLPEGFIVNGNLDLHNSKTTELPRNLEIRGSLDLSDSNISTLPSGLRVELNLNLQNTLVTALPPDLYVGYNLYMCGLPLTEIPPTITVLGSIYLNGSPISSLPEGLCIGENLWLNNAPNITKLPEDISVGGYISISGTPLAQKEKRKRICTDSNNGIIPKDDDLEMDSTVAHSSMNENSTPSIDPSKIKQAVYNRIDFPLPESTWNAIDEAFGDYWNNVLGIGGDIYFNQFFDFIRDRLKEKHILLLPDNLGQVLTIMFDFIEMIGGFLDDPRCPNYELRDKIVRVPNSFAPTDGKKNGEAEKKDLSSSKLKTK